MNQIKIGEFITTLRKEQGMTQRQLAEKIGVSDKTISKWECGRGLPEMSMMEPLCETLNVNINEFLSGERLSEDIYSKKAEENMMRLMEESEKNKRKNHNIMVVFIAGLLTVLLVVVLVIALSMGGSAVAGSVMLFLDCPTILIMLVMTVLFLVITGLGKPFGQAITFKGNVYEDSSIVRMKSAIYLVQRTLLGSGTLITLISFVIIGSLFCRSEITVETLAANIAVSLLGMLYGTIGYLLLLPVRSRIEMI